MPLDFEGNAICLLDSIFLQSQGRVLAFASRHSFGVYNIEDLHELHIP